MDASATRPAHHRSSRARHLLAASLAAALLPFTPNPAAASESTSDDTSAPAAVTIDNCPWGYTTSSTVFFGHGPADSGVPNRDLGDGCTILDTVWAAAPFADHGSFVSTVSGLANTLRQDDVITPQESASIVRAAADSEIGKPQPAPGTRALPDDRIGLVLYTVRATMPAAPEATLAALAACGYRNAEPSGAVNNFYGKTATTLAPLVADAGLSVPSIGIGLTDLQRNLDGVIANAKAFGASYVRISGSASWKPADYSQVAATLNTVGAELKKAGITVAYHNHGFEFTAQNGVRGYDVLVRETDPNLVAMELDLYWASSVGADPVELITQYPGRFSLFHVKDMATDGSFADVGEGTIDFARIFAYSQMAGVDYYLTENDNPRPDGVSSACDSYANLRTLRY
ncbi:sugar phosphate isomerase/epimerase [Micromonospora yasonensis]|uniref:sugar phosphate isomerase/epimerase family protein n=1 Tax=Micromonospora yasonensis TaxID=1128667 RepID=UPI0022309991|nr:sugar phosphate isomerase/epimerase [Micromonospora yasonensis]MCW3841067.1 sugar phosphate isomerase/epimerase [Micromonospora yasonensis]